MYARSTCCSYFVCLVPGDRHATNDWWSSLMSNIAGGLCLCVAATLSRYHHFVPLCVEDYGFSKGISNHLLKRSAMNDWQGGFLKSELLATGLCRVSLEILFPRYVQFAVYT